MGAWWRRLVYLARKERFDRELEEEMRLHRELRAGKIAAEGMPQAEADAAARKRFGNATLASERSRDAWSWAWLERTAQDVRYAARQLRRSPLFTATAILTLALGVGANAAIYTVMDALLWRPLAVQEPDRLAEIGLQTTIFNSNFSYPAFDTLRRSVKGATGLFTWNGTTLGEGWGADAHPIEAAAASGDVFLTLGIQPELGRLFGPEDDTGGAPMVCVLSDAFWRGRFHASRGVIGTTMLLDRKPVSVVGVLPPAFFGVVAGEEPKLVLPIHAAAALNPEVNQLTSSQSWFLSIYGRLRPGVGIAQLRAEVRALTKPVLGNSDMTWMDFEGRQTKTAWLDARLAPGGNPERGEILRDLMVAVGAVSALLLLAACINLATLLMARGATREREISLRAALGANRARLVRQLFTETFLLVLLGSAVGIAFAALAMDPLLRFLDLSIELAPNWRIALLLAVVTAAAALVSGLFPAIRGTSADPGEGLKSGSIGWLGGHRRAMTPWLIPVQAALSMVLLVTAMLYVRTLQNLRAQNLGFDRGLVLVSAIDAGKSGMDKKQTARYALDLVDRLRALPFVRSASITDIPPLGNAWSWNILDAAIWPALSPEQRTLYEHHIGEDYFRAMGTRILLGRPFSRQDLTSAKPRPALLNEVAARTYFPKGDAVGRILRIDKQTSALIAGVVEDAKYASLRDAAPRTIYFPILNDGGMSPYWNVIIRSSADSNVALDALRGLVRQSHRDVSVSEMTAMSRRIDDQLKRERLLATLGSFFGALGAALVAIGLYGVLGYNVARRRREIGVRLALGARRDSVLWMVMRQGLTFAAAGVVVGVPAAIACGHLLNRQLFGVKPADLGLLAASSFLLLLVAALAGLWPSMRASRVDPMEALRSE